jgi:hypothetical protein
MLAETTVCRVRLRSRDADAARLRIGQVLGAADLCPPALPASAVLCIRRLVDPRPKRLRLDSGAVRPPADWEEAARSAIGRLAAHAARPALGPVPAGAEAVLFLDRAEMLACLARDWCDGLVAASWWWQALLRLTDVGAAVVAAWRETPEQAPAAMQLLAARNKAAAFVQRVPPRLAFAFAVEIARAAGVADVSPLLAVGSQAGSQAVAGVEQESDVDSESPTPVTVAGESPEAIERQQAFRYAPEMTNAALAPEQRALAGVALALYRAPAFARGEAVKAIVTSLFVSETAAAAGHRTAGRTGTPSIMSATEATEATFAGACEPAVLAPVPDREAPDAGERTTPGECEAAESVRELRIEPSPGVRDTPLVLRPIECEVDTQWGGAFYLVNVGIALGLYGDFTTPLSRGLSLSIWDFVALVASRLAAPVSSPGHSRTKTNRRRQAFEADPLFELLARLAGRAPDDPPGAGIACWFDWLTPNIRARLARGLGVASAKCGRLLLVHRAHVRLSPAHLDIAFRLAGLPIEIRRAGLDRNPGFVPAAGLTISFTYD